MVTLVTVMVYLFAIGLLVAGVYYQVNKDKLGSDPILIYGCYLFGGGLLIANLVAHFFF